MIYSAISYFVTYGLRITETIKILMYTKTLNYEYRIVSF